jgi:hypothetical protein
MRGRYQPAGENKRSIRDPIEEENHSFHEVRVTDPRSTAEQETGPFFPTIPPGRTALGSRCA